MKLTGGIINEFKEYLIDNDKSLYTIDKCIENKRISTGEFKSQIDSQVKLDMDDNNAIVNGFEFKFGNYEYTFIIKGGLLRMCSRIEQKKRSRKNRLLFFTVFLNKGNDEIRLNIR